MPKCCSLSLIQLITFSLSKLSLLQRMASNDNGKRKLKEEVESSTVRKRLRLSDEGASDDDSSDSSVDETEEEEMPMNQLDTSEEKLFAKCGRSMIFSDNGDTTSPCTPESHWRSDEDNIDEDDDNDDFWM
jgi:hypothetical protein